MKKPAKRELPVKGKPEPKAKAKTAAAPTKHAEPPTKQEGEPLPESARPSEGGGDPARPSETKRASQEACREALAAGKSVEEVKLMAETWFPKTTEKLLCPVFDSTGGLPYCKEQKIIIIKTLLSGHLRQL